MNTLSNKIGTTITKIIHLLKKYFQDSRPVEEQNICLNLSRFLNVPTYIFVHFIASLSRE